VELGETEGAVALMSLEASIWTLKEGINRGYMAEDLIGISRRFLERAEAYLNSGYELLI
jgi:hypothetical protein